jgi:phage-related minor tail protein
MAGASQNIARLGVVLGLDSGELVQEMTAAQQKFKNFTNEIRRDTNDAAKMTLQLAEATERYGKTLTKVEEIELQIRQGRFQHSTDTVKKALLDQAAAYDKVAESAKKAQMAELNKAGLKPHQMAALSYQTTDIVTSLAGGQNPMMVLLQQGGQLKDQFGGIKPLFEAISQVVTVSRVAFFGLAGSIGAVLYAMEKGSEESKKFNNSMALTGNFAGITYDKFNALAETVHTKYNSSISDARDVMQQLVSSSQFTAKALEPVASVITKVAALSGETASVVAQQLIPSFDGSTNSAKKLNDTYHFLTLQQYQHIEAMNKQGKTQEAIVYTANLLKEKLDEQAEQLGYLDKMWKALKNSASDFWDWLKGLGRDDPMKALRNAEYEMNQAASAQDDARYNEAYARWKSLKDKADATKKQAEADSAAAEKNKRNIENYDAAGGASKALQITRETAEMKAQIEYESKAAGLTKIEQIELARQRDIDIAKSAMMKQNEDERFVFAEKRLEQFNLKRQQINAKAIKDEAELYKESRKIFEDKADIELNSIDAERQRLEVYKQNIVSSQQDLDIALSRLKTQQELNELYKRENMSDKDRQMAADRIRYVEKQREAVIVQREELKRLQDMNQSVFNNMGNAIDNFVRTGKLSFKSLAQSIIQDLLSIAMRAQMMAMFRGFSFFGSGASASGANYSLTAGQNIGGQGLKFSGSGFADGGDPPVGMASIVGENGPELFVPRTAGTIIPNGQLGSMQNSQPQVVYNGPYIANMSAIDTQSATQFLAQNKSAVYAANLSAARSMPTNR